VSEGQEKKAVIRTPDRRLRVFVSSALEEFADERRGIAGHLGDAAHPGDVRAGGARPHPPRDVYRAYLARSEVFIGLYWQRYGQAPPAR
jgi:hypothetical protein